MRRVRLSDVLASAWLQALVTGVLAFVVALVAHRIWHADLSVPLNYSGDALQYLAYSKAIHEHGWFIENGNLGAPYGLYLYDWMEGGWASYLGVLTLDRLTGDWVVAHNLAYLFGYPAAALTALWALVRLRIARPVAVALAVLYATLPYHFDRQTGHYVLSFYYGLPPILSYAATTASGRSPLPGIGALSRRAWLGRATPALAAAVLVGLMSAYYVVFAGIFMIAAGIFGWLRAGRRRVPLAAAVLSLVIGATMAVQLSPGLAYRLANGSNADVPQRYHGETEAYPLKPADLLLPVPGHPVGPFAQLRERYSNFVSPGDSGMALGVLGSLGLLIALGGFVAGAARRQAGLLIDRLRPIGFLATVGLAIGVLGGGSTITVLIVGPYLRAWDRIAIAIAFFALAGLGVALTMLRRRGRRPLRRPLLVALAGVLLVGGAVDQAATGAFLRPYSTIAEQWRDDRRFLAEIEAQLSARAMVYQLPYMAFPETRRGEFLVNELLRPYLHSSHLRWSAARMKGREPGWQVVEAGGSVVQVLSLARALGYSGLTLRRDAYPADADPAAGDADDVIAQLTAHLGEATARSADGATQFWPLASDGERPLFATDAADPVWMQWMSGFDWLTVRENHVLHHMRATGAVQLHNRRPAPREVVVTFELEPQLGAPTREISIVWPDGLTSTVTLSGSTVVMRRQLALPPGKTRLLLTASAAPPRGFTTTMVDLAVVDLSMAALLPGATD